MSALTMLGLAVVGAVLYTLFQKSAPAFGLFVSMGAAVLVLWKISTAAEIVLAGLESCLLYTSPSPRDRG